MSMFSFPVGVYSIPAVALELVTTFGASLARLFHAASLPLMTEVGNFEPHS